MSVYKVTILLALPAPGETRRKRCFGLAVLAPVRVQRCLQLPWAFSSRDGCQNLSARPELGEVQFVRLGSRRETRAARAAAPGTAGDAAPGDTGTGAGPAVLPVSSPRRVPPAAAGMVDKEMYGLVERGRRVRPGG